MPKPERPVRGIRNYVSLNSNDYITCVGILTLCSLIGLLFYILGLSEANIISIYILGILVISSLTAKRIFGIISSIVGVLLFNCLFAIPRFTLFFYDLQYSITTIIMLMASLVTSSIMRLFREQLDKEILETRRSEILLKTSQSLQQAQNAQEIMETALLITQHLTDSTVLMLPVREHEFLPPLIKESKNGYPCDPCILESDKDALGSWISRESYMESLYVRTHQDYKIAYFAIQTNESVYAIAGILINPCETIDNFTCDLMYTISREISLALEKHLLREANEHIVREAEAERLRTNLLRSISHDLRTPLTSISGNADILLGSSDQIDSSSRRQLYQNIFDDSEWLIHLVENLLFVSRIDNGAMSVHLEPELLQEVIPEAVYYLERRRKNHNLLLELPDELLMARIDVRLFIQLIINIVDNAIKYTPDATPITVRAFKVDSLAFVEVADTGSGICDEDKGKIFDMFYTVDNRAGDGRRGIGLGLSLCQSIVQAHGGKIYVRDNIPTGAIIGFTIPLEETPLES